MPFSVILDTDFIKSTQDSASNVIKKDRDRYKKVKDVIFDYCVKNQLILSDPHMLCKLEKTNDYMASHQYLIYTCSPFFHANKIANEISKKTKDDPLSKFTALKTVMEKKEFAIEYDFRRFATLYKIQKKKSDNSKGIISPIKIGKAMYFPAEVELIDTYHAMYDPSRVCDIHDAVKFEQILFDQVADRKKKGILGAGCAERKRNMLTAIKIGIVREWLPERNHILIGDWAKEWIECGDKIPGSNEKVQIISDMDPDNCKALLQKYINTLTEFDITYREQTLGIPKDMRTKRYTFYVKIKTTSGIKDKPFLDLFNSTNFEVIPCYNVNKIHVGIKWVMLRFLLIDIWILKIVKSIGCIDDVIMQKKINGIWGTIMYFRNKKLCEQSSLVYRGTHIDRISDKKTTSLQGKTHYPYYPAVYYKKSNTYRVIGNNCK